MMAGSSAGRLTGRVALVTGAGSGIGKAAALQFAREGASVALAGRREEPLVEVQEAIARDGGSAIAFPADVADEQAIERLVTEVEEKLGPLDAAFNNAGVMGAYKPIVEQTAADFDAVIATNLRGVWLLARAEIRAMMASGRRGSIVNTSSFVAEAATPGMSAYAPSKAGLNAMVRALALEVGPQGIRVNNVAPGVIRTAMSDGLSAEQYDALAGHAALKRLGEPEDVAAVAVWLCTDEARFVTGQTISSDGGFAIPGMR
jgi:NAD(P)-dependent dehydrogenase (short-subunit alcohol dehydrogenase family)